MAIDADLNGVIANVGNGVGHWKRMATRLARTLAEPQARSGAGRTERRAAATSGPKYRHDRTVTVIAVNLRAPFLCMREAAKAMREQGAGGQIIQVTSASGLVGNFGQTNYAAAKAGLMGMMYTAVKAGLMGMMYTAVKELGRYDIRCNALWPVARTDMTQCLIDNSGKSAAELGFGEPEDVALGLVWLASDAAAHWNGQCLTLNGRKAALWRSPAEEYVSRQDQPFSMAQLESLLAGLKPLPIYNTRGENP